MIDAAGYEIREGFLASSEIDQLAESLAVTLYGHVIDSARNGGYDTEIPDAVVGVLVSARAAEQYHLEYLLAAGAVPLTTDFTVPDPALLTSTQLIFDTAVQLETAFVAAYTAAAHRFAELGQTDLVRTSLLQRHSGLVHRALYEASEKLARSPSLVASTRRCAKKSKSSEKTRVPHGIGEVVRPAAVG